MYKITKVINNNIVYSQDGSGEEILLRGLGIGFQKKKNDIVVEDKIEKVYRIANPSTAGKLQELLGEIPPEYFAVSTEIIDYAKTMLKKTLNENVYLTLTDHINFSIERKKQGLEYRNALLTEIKRFYSVEYEIGKHALELIREKLNVDLINDEAGFIALHIVNAELDMEMSHTFEITQLIQEVLGIVSSYYERELDEESMHYDRFVTHLKYFGQRLFNNKVTKDDDVVFQKMIKERYPLDYECAEQIAMHVHNTLKRDISNEEKVFLTVHLRRMNLPE
ncbi:BglG family transcription antiterminator LicT [Konateibacter massiliensis]|uniref:BglG family transcription antiterminator LicT n=1 Tax=Konateibacter massiliensis TaxID=2002841 RepID=UPI001F2BC2F1|nr:PRD domain-containing protein [Konateibacter massiliensis]